MYEYAKRGLAGSPSMVIGPSDFILRIHKERGFFPSSPLVRIPLGIEPRNIVHLPVTNEGVRILYVGRLTQDKGVPVLIRAFRNLEYRNACLDIVGDGPDSDLCRKEAKGDGRISFHGFLPHEELGRIYARSHVLVTPSLCYDNSPTVIYEAMSYGLTVIGSRIGGIPELIEHGLNGFLFGPGDWRDLRDLMERLILSPENLRKCSEKAHQTSLRYTMAHHLHQLTDLYENLVQGR
jgi:glycosyltransferase involved in cell wall biosynthesis